MAGILIAGSRSTPTTPPPTGGGTGGGAGATVPTDTLSPDIVVAPPRMSTRYLWRGWDGSTWDLSDPYAGVQLAAGVRGLTMPPVTFYTDDAPGIDGIIDNGFKLGAREVFWPLRVFHAAGEGDWLDLDAAFFRTLLPGKYGTWEVSRADGGSTRTLRCRLADDGDMSWDTDPALTGWAKYGVRLTAPDPYWRGQPITQSWSNSAVIPFLDQPRGIGISDAQVLSAATMSNPGDVNAYPLWVIAGPTTSVDVGVGGRVDQVRFSIPSGKAVILDTSPTIQSAFDATVTTDASGNAVVTPTGVDLTSQLGSVSFASIPPGTASPLSISMTGTGWISATVTPRYLRAW